ncbi:hypothetical protein NTH_02842 [Nitratireductor thuwali]|uniref:Uncharacterized protein n=1 Tax=Nitratireductor thuwali TaxID=2267699 RepID=A0ABY5MLP9_9HYPH|nr:hypothetical protein NTH_02842 [Nitratireductor thuwali]
MGSLRDVQDERSGTNARYRMAAWVGAMIIIIVVAVVWFLWSWIDIAAGA